MIEGTTVIAIGTAPLVDAEEDVDVDGAGVGVMTIALSTVGMIGDEMVIEAAVVTMMMAADEEDVEEGADTVVIDSTIEALPTAHQDQRHPSPWPTTKGQMALWGIMGNYPLLHLL